MRILEQVDFPLWMCSNAKDSGLMGKKGSFFFLIKLDDLLELKDLVKEWVAIERIPARLYNMNRLTKLSPIVYCYTASTVVVLHANWTKYFCI